MQITGSRTLAAPRQQVWDTLNRPDALRQAIPGCEQLEPAGEDRYEAKITFRVAAFKTTFNGTVALADRRPPNRFRLAITGNSSLGSVQATADLTLSGPDGAVAVAYVWDMAVTGTMNTLGRPFLETIGNWFANEFFKRIDAQLQHAH